MALSADGSTALIGITYVGAAYVFEYDGLSWQQAEKLTGDAIGWFGQEVALSEDGNTAVVGSAGEQSSSGAVYVFTRSGTDWVRSAKLIPTNSAPQEWFGHDVAISADGTSILVGATGKDNGRGPYGGAAYVYTTNGNSWTESRLPTPADNNAYDYFGYAVALSDGGDVALISADVGTVSPPRLGQPTSTCTTAAPGRR